MKEGARTSRISAPVAHRVYVRRAQAPGGALPIDGKKHNEGWTRDFNLRCERVQLVHGAAVGTAVFSYIPAGPGAEAFEAIMALYTVDDQVRVVVDPLVDELVEQPAPDAEGHTGNVVFEGVLSRHVSNINADARGGDERVGMIARALPAAIDNRIEQHLIIGRWTPGTVGEGDDAVEVLKFIESPDLPPVANFRGRPTLHGTKTITVGPEGYQITAPVWSGGDSEDDKPATVREMLASVIAAMLYGLPAPGKPLPRNIDVERNLMTALNVTKDAVTSEGRPEQFRGFDDILPEVNLLGLHVLDAIELICEKAGFDFCCWPLSDAQMAAEGPGEGSDRRWQLRLWRKGTGTLAWLDLAKRGSTFADDEAYTAANNTPRMNGMRDGSEIANVMYVAAPLYITARFPLVPLWSPADLAESVTAASLRNPSPAKLQTPGEGVAKYVKGGIDFAQYGHVGRMWGLDCTGAPEGTYYDTPNGWFMEPEGFDFANDLTLSGPLAGEDCQPMLDERPEFLAPVTWLKRLRRVLPIKHPEAKKRDLSWIIEASEDSGATWKVLSTRASSLERHFGIMFTSIENLSKFSIAFDQTQKVPAASASWWQKLLDRTLRLRITCTIAADHTQMGYASRRGDSGSAYPLAQWVRSEVEDVWVWPDLIAPFTVEEATRISGWSVSSDAETPGAGAQDMAHRRREAMEHASQSFSVNTFVMDLSRYQIGQRVRGVRNRGYEFNSGGGRYPNIVGITVHLSPGVQQGIELALEDQRFAGIKYGKGGAA